MQKKRRVSISSHIPDEIPADFFQPIDFLFADKLVQNGPEAMRLFLAYLLKSAREGHLCVPLSTELDPRLLEGASLLPPKLFEEFLVSEESRIYLRRNWECEHTFLTHFRRLMDHPPSYSIAPGELEKLMESEKLNQEQKGAILKVAASSVTLISGGPGTGKTYTAASLIRLFYACGVKTIAVAAPTGKATANLRAALSKIEGLAEACTIKTLHSLLKGERLYADLLLVDEGSMVDAELMARLFKSIKDGAQLVLLGDKNQLPPVESGNFFADLAGNPNLVAELKTCLRTELQEIIGLAERVKGGEAIPATPLPSIRELIPYIAQSGMHVLTPLRKGPFGVENLNQQLHAYHMLRGEKKIPILITVNDSYLELFNGDTGVLHVEEKCAYFSGGRKFAEHLLPRFEYAYALSVHKSQGSEYDRVLILLPKGSETFGREMLYTALTRAKREIQVFEHAGIVDQVVKGHYPRYSALFDCQRACSQ